MHRPDVASEEDPHHGLTYSPIGKLQSSPVITRHPANPVLSAKDIPYEASQIFNAGVTKYQGYVMVPRNDSRESAPARRIRHIPTSAWPPAVTGALTVHPKPCFEMHDEDVLRAHDPRLTVMDGKCYMCFAIDTRHGVRGGIALTEDSSASRVLCTTA